MPSYLGSLSRVLNDKLGEHISVLDFGAVGDGVVDNALAFSSAIAAAVAVGGCEIFVPKGTYLVNSPIVLSSAVFNVSFVGDGPATVIKRGANLTAGQGLFDVSGVNIQFRRFLVDGAVTAFTGLQYGTFSDPMDARLATNSSFWVHGGSKKVRFVDVTVQHTGGYAILLDATTADISDVSVLDCTFENNRPHLFGPSGDLNYGSWTGGVHWQGDGVNYALKNLVVRHCTFRRNTGNCVWGHAYGFGRLHSNLQVSGNYFEDCGLDGVEVGAQSGGVVEGNRFRRMGYICLDDTSASTPKFLVTAYACAIDTTGLARGVNYQNNTFMSVNGGCMDLDGFCQGTVSGNTCIIPSVGEPEYTEDSIATFGNGNSGSNWVYGCQPSNTNNISLPGTDITVLGNTFINMGGGAVRMFAARNCVVTGNNIIHSASANYPPISLGNIGTGPYQQANGNVVIDNQISWSPSAIGPAVFEDATYGAFTVTDKNWVSGNRLQGNCYEFQKDPNSSSSTAVVASSGASNLAVRSENVVQRESVGATAVYRNYQNTAAGMTAFSSLFDVLSNSGGTAVGGPLFNVSNNGAAGSGSFSTAGRTTAVFDDAVLTGKLWGDSFLALTDSTYLAAAANLLPATVGLLRYNSSTGQFLQSVSLSSGARVWTALGGTPPGGSNTHVQYNSGGAFAGSGNLVWSNASQLLTVTAASSGVAGLAVATGYIQADAGFYATSGVATSYQSFNAPTGGLYGRSFRSIYYTQVGNSSGAPSLTSGDAFQAGALYYDTGAAAFKYYTGSGWSTLVSGGGVTSLTGTANQVNVSASTGAVTLSLPQSIATGSSVTFGNVTVAGVFQSTATGSTISFQNSSGNFQVDGNGNISGGGTANLVGGYLINGVASFRRSGASLQWSTDGSTWNTFSSGGTPPGGSNTHVQYNSGGSFAGSGNHVWNNAAQLLTVYAASSGSAGIAVATGFIQADTGFYATSGVATSYQTFNAPTGGMYARSVRATVYSQVGQNYGAPTMTSGDSVQYGGLYYDTSTNLFKGYTSSGWLTLLTGTVVNTLNGFSGSLTLSSGTGISVSGLTITNTGVTAVYAGTGISVNANTGGLTVTNTGVTSIGGYTGSCSLSGGTGVSISGLTISIGQAVGTGNSVSFYSVSISTGMQINQSGGYGLYLPSSYVYANGFNSFNSSWNGIQSSGGISSASGYYMSGGGQVINSSGVFCGSNGINVGSAGISCGAYAINGGYYGGTFTFLDQGGTTHSVRGGILLY